MGRIFGAESWIVSSIQIRRSGSGIVVEQEANTMLAKL